ncbi:MAG: diaminopimelate decarboxylase [Bacillota bacterium]|nr:diaminopimelate decarboxylase [Bacillota bacterium]
MKVNNHYIFGGVDTVELAKKHETPLYVLSEDIIMENINTLKKCFIDKYEDVKVLYASKAFLSLAMAQIINREGLGIDVVSGGELFTVMKAGFDSKEIFFHGNNKTRRELEMAIDYGVGQIVVDNLHELELLVEILKKENKTQDILLRLSPGLTDIETHEYIITGQRDTKFGFQIDESLKNDIIPRILSEDSLDLKGFHYHIGSQLFDNMTYINAFKIIFDLIEWTKDMYNYSTEILNIGGGFGIPYQKDTQPLDIEKILSEIMKTIENEFTQANLQRPQVIIEPGRWIIGPAGITIYKIGAVKSIEDVRTYAAVDGGMADNIRPSLYKALYSADIANKYGQEKNHLYTIAGKACESGDILVKDINLPEIETGDYLIIHTTGAYNFSMASNYNRMLIPAVVLVGGGKERVIVKRQSYEDIISRDVAL